MIPDNSITTTESQKQSTIPTTKDTQTQPQCPTDDSRYGLMDGRCVYFEQVRLTYEEAIENCHEKLETFGGGVLYEPNSTHELKRIMKMGYGLSSTMSLSKGVWWYWIGVTDIANEGQFTYNSSNQTINFNPEWVPHSQTQKWGSRGPSYNCVTVVTGYPLDSKRFAKLGEFACNKIKKSICWSIS